MINRPTKTNKPEANENESENTFWKIIKIGGIIIAIIFFMNVILPNIGTNIETGVSEAHEVAHEVGEEADKTLKLVNIKKSREEEVIKKAFGEKYISK